MGWLINSKHVFLTILEGGKSKIKVSADPVSGEIHFLVRAHLLVRKPQAFRSSLGSLVRELVPFMRALSPKNHLPNIQPPNAITSGFRLQHMTFRRKHSVVEY